MFEDVSELEDCDLVVIGTVKLWKFASNALVLEPMPGLIDFGSSSGISSGAGIGFPLAAATS